MAYGQIIRNATAAGSPFAHTLTSGAGNYCCFLIQDTTTAGAQRALQDAFIGTVDKAAAAITINDTTAAGACNLDVLLLEAHSIIDVGPVVAGNTRAATNVYGGGKNRPSYRSLHRAVRFTSAGGVAFVDVNVAHRLNTTNVVTFASPLGTMIQAGENIRCFQQAVVDVNTVTMRIVCSAGANIGAGDYDWDIMVLGRTAAGLVDVAHQPLTMRRHRATAGANIGLPSDDYSGADLARSQTGAIASYASLYQNVDAIVAGGLALTHNMGSATGAMALVGYSATPAAAYPITTNNATSTTTMTLARQGADINNAYLYFVRPYTMVVPSLTNVP